MKIEGGFNAHLLNQAEKKNPLSVAGENLKSFQSVLENALGEVHGLQKDSEQKSLDVLLGKSENVHDAMIAMEKGKIALNLTIEVQNKLLEAYKEVNRIQV